MADIPTNDTIDSRDTWGNVIRLSLDGYCLLFSTFFAIHVFYKPNNTLNHHTMLPFYLAIAYFGFDTTQRALWIVFVRWDEDTLRHMRIFFAGQYMVLTIQSTIIILQLYFWTLLVTLIDFQRHCTIENHNIKL